MLIVTHMARSGLFWGLPCTSFESESYRIHLVYTLMYFDRCETVSVPRPSAYEPPPRYQLHVYIYWFFLVCQTVYVLVSKLLLLYIRVSAYQQWRMVRQIRQLFMISPSPSVLRNSRTHEAPVSEGEILGQWVEWDVAPWTLWVVVWRSELWTSGREAATGDGVEAHG